MSATQSPSQPSTSAPGAPLNERERIIGEKPDSCVPYFDRLWFCYSKTPKPLTPVHPRPPAHFPHISHLLSTGPVHQMKEYYTYGTVDDCTGHWGKLMACLRQRTRFKDDPALDTGVAKHPLWKLRTGLEAKEFWRAEFGGGEGGQAGGQGPSEGRPTMV